MFQFTNTIVLNSLRDSSGLDKIVSREVDGKPALDIRRVNLFKQANVYRICKREASDEVLGQATITLPATLDKGFYRLKLYIRLSGSENSYYANDFAIKGKPLYYEFSLKANTAKATVAKDVVNIVNKLQSFYGEKWVKASVFGGDQIQLRGVDEFQVFTEAKIERLVPGEPTSYNKEHYEEIGSGEHDSGYAVELIRGREGFGTYIHILKDLRLPTMEHLRFEAHNQEELPIPGAKYDQFTLYYKVDRGLFGGAAVGQQVTSMTTHVFYVNQAISAQFEKALVALVKGSSPTVALENIQDPLAITATATDGTIILGGEAEKINIKAAPSGKSATKVSAYTDADWLKQTTSDTSSVTVTAPANNTQVARTAEVTVVAVDKNKAVAAKKVQITQGA